MKNSKTIFQQVVSLALSLVLSASLLTNVVYGASTAKYNQIQQVTASDEVNPVGNGHNLNLAIFKTATISYGQPLSSFILPVHAPSLSGILHKIIPSSSIQFEVSTFLRNVFYVFISTNAP